MTILITGAAGFIGTELSLRLLAAGHDVVGTDNLNGYYNIALKHARLSRLEGQAGFTFHNIDLTDEEGMKALIRNVAPEHIIHLAAQAGVRHSLKNPQAYVDANVKGHVAVLEGARDLPNLKQLLYASSSSVYGDREGGPFKESDPVTEPKSLYAASKRAGELISESYASLYGLPQSGLRFFTVYGPWGRPDMAYWTFTDKILAGEPIDVFNNGEMARDFTFVDDIVSGIVAILDHPPAGPANRILNIGGGRPEKLLDMIHVIAEACGREPILQMKPKQAGDVTVTYADTSTLKALTGFVPQIPIQVGLPKFVEWRKAHSEF